jgi:membrane protease subunit HflC
MKSVLSLISIFVVVALAILANASLYTVDMREQVVITRFQQVVGEPIKTPGLKFKMPFVDKVNRFSKMVMEWDGPGSAIPTKEKVNIVVDTFARWQIKDPLVFMKGVRDERSAQSRLNDVIDSETRKVIASHEFIEVVRSTKDRVVVVDETIVTPDSRLGKLTPIKLGRQALEAMILKNARPKIEGWGIELLDVRVKRINYNPDVLRTIYDRMTSERMQIADRFRSEGAGEAAKKLGERDRDLKEIESEAYKKIQEIEGAADAKATEIYAKAYNASPESVELFTFVKSMETLRLTITPDSTMILTTNGDLMGYLKSMDSAKTVPATTSIKSAVSAAPVVPLAPAPAVPAAANGTPGLPSLQEVKP